ncbi:small glutamine-rich tetratricopeptide repeat-containing protein alpha [Colletes latitarsis]|uniref:small glutamine-rich tetratricopeptide repeat-containing protein alpha n=1 Tax=Colletes latitarsis TaxID=2605962 RepID=UPI0040374110
MAVKGLIAAIVQFLTQQLESGDITVDSMESLEVAIQCLGSAYNVQASDTPANFNLYQVYSSFLETARPQTSSETTPEAIPEATPEAKATAERLKNDGNTLMKAGKHHEAIANYTKAIELDGRNAVFYCNRAAAYSKIGNHEQAIKDCQTTLSIDPSYCKAYGRLGLAYSSLERHKEAKESYEKALEMEPDNESYKNNLQVSIEKLAQQDTTGLGVFPGMDLSAVLNTPALVNMASQILFNPVMQSIMSTLVNDDVGREVLLETGLRLSQQIQNANPEVVQSLRQQMGGNQNDPEPPQQN